MDKPTKKTLIIIVAIAVTCILAFGAVLAWTEDTLVRDGATCDIPDGYNSAPYSADYNVRGMGKFCVFPAKPWVDAITAILNEHNPPDLPECHTLSFGDLPVFPCYEVRTE